MANLEPIQLLTGAMIFLRISAILFALPIIGDSPTPVRARILLAVALAFGLYPVVPITWAPNLVVDIVVISHYVVNEIIIGLIIGFTSRIAFAGVLMAASICGYQMGFGTASLLVPSAGAQMSGFMAFHRAMVFLIFLGLGLHHIFIQAIVESFTYIPGGGAIPNTDLGTFFINLTGGIFVTALQLAAPVLIALLFTMAALGLIARAVPQMNVFTLSFPASFFIGLSVYLATIPFFPEWMQAYFLESQTAIFTSIRGMAP